MCVRMLPSKIKRSLINVNVALFFMEMSWENAELDK